MATNNFKDFAQAGGSRVYTQAEYEAVIASLTGGLPAGILNGVMLNKILRQQNAMAVALAKFIVNATGSDVLDAGNTDSLAVLIRSAVESASLVASSGLLPITTVTTTTYTLLPSDMGRSVRCTNAAGCTITVPGGSTFTDTCVITLRAAGAGGITLTAPGVVINTPASLVIDYKGTGALHKVGLNEYDLMGALA